MNYSYDEVVIGALLHDIGKMVSRLKGGEPYTQDDLSEYKYEHAKLTHEFLQNQLFVNEVAGIDWKKVSVLAAKHHKPTDEVQRIIQRSDWWSAGLDRGDEKRGKANIHLKALFSEDKTIPFKEYSSMTDDPFPMFACSSQDKEGISDGQFEQHAKYISEQFGEHTSPSLVVDSISWFLKKFLYCTPADMCKATEISLYDHAVTTAAIASALYRYIESEGSTIDALDTVKPFLIVAGGIDGIQRFISAIQGTKGAAKALRGRSAFVQLFTEYVKNRLLKELGLRSPSVIMNAAGKFWILAANTASAKETVNRIKNEIEDLLASRFAFQLSFNVGLFECSSNDLIRGNFKDTYDKIKETVRAEEGRPFYSVLEKKYVFEDPQAASGSEACKLCNMHARGAGEHCSVCAAMVDLGGELTKASGIVWCLSDDRLSGPLDDVLDAFPKPKFVSDEEFFQSLSSKDVFATENIEFEAALGEETNRIIVPHRAVGRYVPDADLAELCEGRYLAALKVDVDDLGVLFQKRALDSLGKLSTFSRVIDFFFSEYIQYELENNPKFNRKIYTVFSGGDDLFVLGDLKGVVDLAFHMRERFTDFSDNKDVHFSAGISVHHASYPVRYITEAAEAELRLAKAGGKNAISFQGDVKRWDVALAWKNTLDRIIEKKWCPTKMDEGHEFKRDFWRKLLITCYEHRRVTGKDKINEPKINDYLYDAHIKYYLARNYSKLEGDAKKFVDGIRSQKADSFLDANFSAIRLAIWLAREREGGR